MIIQDALEAGQYGLGLDEPRWNKVETREPFPFVYRGVAISGKICSGKSTLAAYISESEGIPVKSLASELKRQVFNALVKSGLEIDPTDFLLRKDRFRSILQGWGQAFRYFNGEDYWVEKLMTSKPKPPFVVDDLRYQNELEALRKHGFLIVRLEVSQQVQLDRASVLYPTMNSSHLWDPSETDLDRSHDKFDIVLDADARFEEVNAEFDRLTERFRFVWRKEAAA